MKKTLTVTITIKDRTAKGGSDKTTENVVVEYNAERNLWQHELANGVLTYGESAHGLAARICAETVGRCHGDS